MPPRFAGAGGGPPLGDASPRRLFQESLRRRPFWMLAACVLVNRTTWRQARPVHLELMRRHTIRTLAAADPERDVRPLLVPLGLHGARSRSLVAMAASWTRRRPKTADDVARLPGCGQYAADSWAIFIDGETDIEPDDGKLAGYLRRVENG